MNKKSILLFIPLMLGMMIITSSLSAQKYADVQLKTAIDSLSYIIGLDMGSKGMDITPDVIARAIEDIKMRNKPLLDSAQIANVVNNFQKQMIAKQPPVQKEQSFKNRVEGSKFLEENKKKKGVITLPSGLQYKVITEGKGPKPLLTDKVTVHYRGKLLDGTVFDASYDRKEPIVIGLTQVIKGWTEGLQYMQVGGKYELYIPSELAYGDAGAGQLIGPGSVLVFEIELLKINGK